MDTKDRNNLIIIGVAVIVVIIIGWLIIAHNRTSSDVTGTSTGTQATSTAMDMSTGGLTVNDQAAGLSVAVASMDITKDSWIAIKDSNGWILGAGRFAPGTTSGSVPLLRGTLAGKTYTAVIYTDDGDKAFDLHKDTLVDGVSATFKAQ